MYEKGYLLPKYTKMWIIFVSIFVHVITNLSLVGFYLKYYCFMPFSITCKCTLRVYINWQTFNPPYALFSRLQTLFLYITILHIYIEHCFYKFCFPNDYASVYVYEVFFLSQMCCFSFARTCFVFTFFCVCVCMCVFFRFVCVCARAYAYCLYIYMEEYLNAHA